jgi:hypothetical protein
MLLSRSDTTETPRWARSRRWRVPPALLRNPGDHELLEGESILREYPDGFGLLLWECYRDVRLWTDTPPELRRELFHGTCTGQRPK